MKNKPQFSSITPAEASSLDQLKWAEAHLNFTEKPHASLHDSMDVNVHSRGLNY